MICPCCNGKIRIVNDEGVCDYCTTFVSAGMVFKDLDFNEEEED